MMGHNKLLMVKLGKSKNLCIFLRLSSQVIHSGNTWGGNKEAETVREKG
jgi:hypothetical protein